jgi:hypothetical protein
VFAVKIPEVAMPLLSVVALDESAANVPLGPDAGAVQVTVVPLIRFPEASLTLARNLVANGVPARVLCGVPAVAAMTDGGPGTTERIPEVAGGMVPKVARIHAVPTTFPMKVADFMSEAGMRSP